MFLSKPLPNPSAGSWRSPQFVNMRPAQSFSRGLNIFMSFRGFRRNMFPVRWLSIFISPKTSSTSCSVTSNLHFWAKKSNQKMKTSKWLLSMIQTRTTDLCQKLHNMDLMKVPQFLLLYLPHFIVVLKSVDMSTVLTLLFLITFFSFTLITCRASPRFQVVLFLNWEVSRLWSGRRLSHPPNFTFDAFITI